MCAPGSSSTESNAAPTDRESIPDGRAGVRSNASSSAVRCGAWRARSAGAVSGLLALTVAPIWALTVESFAGPELALTTARGAWVALYYWSFLAVLTLAAAIPHRPVSRMR